MNDEPRDRPDGDRDSSDVVTGAIGSAHLVEPTEAEALSADLEQLPTVHVDDDATSGATERPLP